MHDDTITFQLATHYLPKIALRLEYLFLSIHEACEETHPVIHHNALQNILEIIKLIEKPELKSRFLKEFMRIEHTFNKSQINLSNTLYAALFIRIQHLNQVAGKFSEAIINDPFLQSVRLAQASHHHDVEMHSPQLRLWLENQATKRQQDLYTWLKPLQILYDTVNVYLALLRHVAEFESIDMTQGFYQRILPTKATCHLILLKMNKQDGIVPKVQWLGQNGFSLRLCDANSMHEIAHPHTSIDLAISQL